MPIGPLAKLSAANAAEVCKQLELSDAARDLTLDGLSCDQFLDQLMERRLQLDAIRFLAAALPKREAVWWAARCAQTAVQPNAPSTVFTTLNAVDAWTGDPQDANRRAAKQAGEQCLDTPAGVAAMAAFFADGSMAPPEVQNPVPPPPDATAKCVAGAVLLAGVVVEPEKSPEKYTRFLEEGLAVARGQAGPTKPS